jgi:hypothetical protein
MHTYMKCMCNNRSGFEAAYQALATSEQLAQESPAAAALRVLPDAILDVPVDFSKWRECVLRRMWQTTVQNDYVLKYATHGIHCSVALITLLIQQLTDCGMNAVSNGIMYDSR